MRSRTARIWGWIAAGVGALLLVLILFLAFFDWNHLSGPIAGMASKRMDRQVAIGGLRARLLSLNPTIEVTGLKIGQPAWVADKPAEKSAEKSEMVDVERILVEFKWGSLLTGHPILPRLEIDKPNVYLVRRTEVQTNWQFGRQPAKPDSKPLGLPVVRNFLL